MKETTKDLIAITFLITFGCALFIFMVAAAGWVVPIILGSAVLILLTIWSLGRVFKHPTER